MPNGRDGASLDGLISHVFQVRTLAKRGLITLKLTDFLVTLAFFDASVTRISKTDLLSVT